MNKLLLSLLFTPLLVFSQGENITSWSINTTGHQAQYYNSSNNILDLNDSSEVLQVCYNNDTIFVRTNMLAHFIMGDWPGDPFLADGQDKSYVFPRNPTYPSSAHQPKPTGLFGLQINGVALYDDGDGKSYNTSTGKNDNNGSGVWNQIAWEAHISEMDSGNAHPDPNNVYHNHHNPIKLCSVTNNSQHSPIIGWAFDGWPIYGPFGYSSALDPASAISRMSPSWQLRNITSRTTLYDGTTTSQVGPNVSISFPLGIYIEDYEYVSGLGDLDYYNGRYCVTPEFPSGTYAYFLNTDASGNPSYPNMVGPNFYGSVYMANFGMNAGNANMPLSATCYVPVVVNIPQVSYANEAEFYPNPVTSQINIPSSGKYECVEIINAQGMLVYQSVNVNPQIDISTLNRGVYTIICTTKNTINKQVIVKQ